MIISISGSHLQHSLAVKRNGSNSRKNSRRPCNGKNVYILDEPTTGLHFHDIGKLIEILQSLVDRGNTVLVIEHNMDLVKTTDWIIELGPEGGAGGGKLIAEGTPEKIIQGKTATAIAFKEHFETPTAARRL